MKLIKLSSENSWFYCETNSNPSDLLTKLSFPLSQLKEKNIYWEGPKFLKDYEPFNSKHNNILYKTEN